MTEINKDIVDEWDSYWKVDKIDQRIIYNLIAQFYRRFLIRPSLNHYVTKYFPNNSVLLHAGCGSGDVDKDIGKYYQVFALDISSIALELYRKINGKSSRIIKANLFNIPKNRLYDGIYNLGVMEHYNNIEIQKILKQFSRVLKKRGKLLLFWPPEYGMSVVFFKVLVFISIKILGLKNVKFHPNEITRLNNLNHLKNIFRKSDFNVVKCHFGVRDLFTYLVILAQKK